MYIFLNIEVDNKKTIQIEEDALLVFVDETGDDKTSDINFPVFGLGGCAVFSQDYDHHIHIPWTIFKRRILGNTDKVLHAADLDLDSLPKEELNLLGDFFKNGEFKRFGFTLTKQAELKNGIGKYQVLATLLSKHIVDITHEYPKIRHVYIFFEYNTEGNKSINKFFREVDFVNLGSKVLVQNLVANKGILNGLEVADFVIQAAGAQTRNRLNGKSGYRKDFSTIFHDCDVTLKKFFQVTKAG